MLKVKIGYNYFLFPKEELNEAMTFAITAYDHSPDKDERDQNVSIIFSEDKEEE